MLFKGGPVFYLICSIKFASAVYFPQLVLMSVNKQSNFWITAKKKLLNNT